MFNKENYPVLAKVQYPDDLKKLDRQELKPLCADIRKYLIESVSVTGGHFGSGLGAVETAVALHRVFDTPHDQIVWDTGHQAYPHKILTGRKEALSTIRQLNGISGFLKRSESEYDNFGAGHASTSISAALGIAVASELNNIDRNVLAVIGDGAMTGGMAYEAMNNAGLLKANLKVIFNDNRMSISPNVSSISNYFTGLISRPEYNKFKGYIWDLTGKMDGFGDRIRHIASRLEGGIKAVITPGMLFEALGFRYFGPINGHNVHQLVRIFDSVKNLRGPILIHVITEKGKGYKPAEDDAVKLHALSPASKIPAKKPKTEKKAPSYTAVFGEALVDIIKDNKDVVGITAAMAEGTGLDKLRETYHNNYFDVGIAEEHAVTFAAGMATQGSIPVVAVYSTFLQRAYDHALHDVALQNLHVVFALDRAGLVGADGPTHHGSFDLSYLRTIPNMVIMSPKDENELRDMLYTAVNYKKGPVALRYPRGKGLGVPLNEHFTQLPIGRGETLRSGSDAALLAVGNMVGYAQQAAEELAESGYECEVVNMRFVKPLDTKLLDDIAQRHDKIITLEENSLAGGFGSGVSEYFSDKRYKNDILRIGLPDDFVEHGTQSELHSLLGIDKDGIVKKVKSFCNINKAVFNEQN